MQQLYIIVGAIVGLLIVRGFLLDPLEEIGWRMFWNALFNGKLSAKGMDNVLGSATFIKSVMGIALGGIAGFFAYKKK